MLFLNICLQNIKVFLYNFIFEVISNKLKIFIQDIVITETKSIRKEILMYILDYCDNSHSAVSIRLNFCCSLTNY